VGAHAVLYHRKPHEDALRSWAKKLMQTKPFKLVAVALANKMARIAFAIMRGKLGRYEVHLDRKLERMLAMLLRLKDLRQGAIEG
jgi:hypothetical protein